MNELCVGLYVNWMSWWDFRASVVSLWFWIFQHVSLSHQNLVYLFCFELQLHDKWTNHQLTETRTHNRKAPIRKQQEAHLSAAAPPPRPPCWSPCRYECDVISDAGGPTARPRWPSSAQQLPVSALPLSCSKLRPPAHLSTEHEVHL